LMEASRHIRQTALAHEMKEVARLLVSGRTLEALVCRVEIDRCLREVSQILEESLCETLARRLRRLAETQRALAKYTTLADGRRPATGKERWRTLASRLGGYQGGLRGEALMLENAVRSELAGRGLLGEKTAAFYDDALKRMTFARRALQAGDAGADTTAAQSRAAGSLERVARVVERSVDFDPWRPPGSYGPSPPETPPAPPEAPGGAPSRRPPNGNASAPYLPGPLPPAPLRFADERGTGADWGRLAGRSRRPADPDAPEKLHPRWRKVLENYFKAMDPRGRQER